MVTAENRQIPSAQWVEIGPEQSGQRVDNFLLTRLRGVPRTRIYRSLRRGEVRVNRGRVPVNYRLQVGDLVRLPPLRQAQPMPVVPGQSAVQQIATRILFEDKSILIVNKPFGMAVHGGSGISYGVIEALRALRPEAPFLELVHRLDRDTSGCLIIAKRRSVLRALHTLLREGSIDKRYQTLVVGYWPHSTCAINYPLRRNVLRGGERTVRVDPQGKPAVTRFRVLERFRLVTLLGASPVTGRTHQIRVHAAAAGHPVAGDDKYGEERANRTLRDRGLKRLFLHAASLSLQLPESPQPLTVHAPLEPELSAVLDTLRRR